jgi:maltooligosyltrehalose trehalohydrolase
METEKVRSANSSMTSLGAVLVGEGRCRFRVWAPLASKVHVRFLAPERRVPMQKSERGYHSAAIEGVNPGDLYLYQLETGKERPDPASRFQPHGVQGPSQIIDPHFAWQDGDWIGLALRDYVIYELHVGTFTEEGTFEAAIEHVDYLKQLGITAVELMPVAQFPGSRNWGYDGVYAFAVQNSYGGPEGLKRLVNACHQRGLAVILDVCYNHVGPEGNYLADFAPYFTERYKTPWGPALNFDGPYSDEVRRFFIENALYWIVDFHIDALRLDAVHAILDHSPVTFLEQLGDEVHETAKCLNREVYLLAESAANDARLVRSRQLGGYGLDAVWSDDFHHSLHVLLTGDRSGYYQDFGQVHDLIKAYREGFTYSGNYSQFRKRRHGSSSLDIAPERFIVFTQNHDQVGNRALGERFSQLVSFEGLKLAAGIVLLSPFVPLLFMGEEYGEIAPFPYFISHSDAELIEAVRRGRREEFAAFQWRGEIPDPQDEATFLCAKLNHDLRHEDRHKVLLKFYRELIRLRRVVPALKRLDKKTIDVIGNEREKVLIARRWSGDDEVFAIFNFNDAQVSVAPPVHDGRWRKRLDSAQEQWRGGGSSLPCDLDAEKRAPLRVNPKALVLFTREK